MASEPNTSIPKGDQPWQFSLRILFILLTVVCLLFGWLGPKLQEAREDREFGRVVQAITDIGGRVYSDGIAVDLSDARVSDVTHLAGLTKLKFLDLSNTQVNDVTPLAKLTNLKYLNLGSTQVSDLKPLRRLTKLTYLDRSNTQVNDVTPLAKLTNLDYLNLMQTTVSEEQVKKLRIALPNCTIDWSPPSSVKSP